MRMPARYFVVISALIVFASGCSSDPGPTSALVARPRLLSASPIGEIFVTETSPTKVLTFLQSDSGDVSPQRVIDGSGVGARSFTGLAVANDGSLFVTDSADEEVLEYARSASGPAAPLSTITCAGFNGPSSVDFDKAGDLYVANSGSAPFSISVLRPGASGCVTGNALIVGGHTGLFNPQGIQSTSTGRLYVLDNSSSITEYAPGATGNAGWTHRIHGPDTLLETNSECGNAIYVDGAGVMYVANANGNSITAYAHDANGDAKPIRDIVGSNTALDQPRAITVNAAGEIFVVNSESGTITVYAADANGNAPPIRTIAGPKTGMSGFVAGIASGD